MPSIWDRFKNSSAFQDYISPAWDFATDPLLPDVDTGNKWLDVPYETLIQPLSAPLAIAAGAMPAKRAAKYLGKAATKPPVSPTPTSTGIPERIRDDVKQIAMTFGVPGTGISSHGVALAAAHLKGTPFKSLPKEAWETARMLYNPERAVAANKKLTGGFSPQQKRDEFTAQIMALAPQARPRNVSAAVEAMLDAYAPRGTRFKDILDLERKGLKTSDVLGGTSKGTTGELITRPIGPGNTNVNPFHYQKELYDTPLFGEEYVNTYFKRKTALDELDRARAVGLSDPEKSAVDFATNTLGGYGVGSKSVFNSDAAKWFLTAPDWTRRHFALLGKKAESLKPSNWSNPEFDPYRRYIGYDLAGLGGVAGANYALNEDALPDRASDIGSIQLPGKWAGKTALARPFSTEMDLPRSIFAATNALGPQAGWYSPEEKDLGAITEFWRYRMHPFTRAGLETIEGKDWRGRSLYGNETYSKMRTTRSGRTYAERPDIPQLEALQRTGSNALRNVLPQAWDVLEKKYTQPQRISPLELYAGMGELPFQFYTPKYTQINPRSGTRNRTRGRR